MRDQVPIRLLGAKNIKYVSVTLTRSRLALKNIGKIVGEACWARTFLFGVLVEADATIPHTAHMNHTGKHIVDHQHFLEVIFSASVIIFSCQPCRRCSAMISVGEKKKELDRRGDRTPNVGAPYFKGAKS